MPDDDKIVLGIMISDAAIIAENAFRDVLGMSPAQLAALNPDNKFEKYCDKARLDAMLDYVSNDRGGGLPSMQPSRMIEPNALSGISVGSAIRLLISRLSQFAYYPVA